MPSWSGTRLSYFPSVGERAGFCEKVVSSTREKERAEEGQVKRGGEEWLRSGASGRWRQLKDISACLEASVLAVSTAALQGFSSGFSLLGRGGLDPRGRAGKRLVCVSVFALLSFQCPVSSAASCAAPGDSFLRCRWYLGSV